MEVPGGGLARTEEDGAAGVTGAVADLLAAVASGKGSCTGGVLPEQAGPVAASSEERSTRVFPIHPGYLSPRAVGSPKGAVRSSRLRFAEQRKTLRMNAVNLRHSAGQRHT